MAGGKRALTPPRVGGRFLQRGFGTKIAVLCYPLTPSGWAMPTASRALLCPLKANLPVSAQSFPCLHKPLHFCTLKICCFLGSASGAVICTHLASSSGLGQIPHVSTSPMFILACRATVPCLSPDIQAHSSHVVLVTRIHHLCRQSATKPESEPCFKQTEMCRTYQTPRWKSEPYSSKR